MLSLLAQMSVPGGVRPSPPTWHDNLRAWLYGWTGIAIPPLALLFLAGAIALAGLFVIIRMDRQD